MVLTTGALGLLSSWLIPSLGLAAAFVLGAVLAPPDTITTVSHGDEIGLPKRVTSILTGESLVNDATALTLFSDRGGGGRTASTPPGTAGSASSSGTRRRGLLIGGVFAAATLWIRKRLGNPTLETALVLLLPFTAFLTAEEAHASGILAVVAASFLVSVNLTLDPQHQYPGAYLTRLQEDGVWPVLDFLLETFVFAYIGLQLKFVLAELAESEDPGLVRTLVAAGVLLVAAIVLRLAGVYGLFGRWAMEERSRRRRLERHPELAERLQTPGGQAAAPGAATARSADAEGDVAGRLDRDARHADAGRGRLGAGGHQVRRAVPGAVRDPGDRADRHAGHAADPGHHPALGGPGAEDRSHRGTRRGRRDARRRPGDRRRRCRAPRTTTSTSSGPRWARPSPRAGWTRRRRGG